VYLQWCEMEKWYAPYPCSCIYSKGILVGRELSCSRLCTVASSYPGLLTPAFVTCYILQATSAGGEGLGTKLVFRALLIPSLVPRPSPTPFSWPHTWPLNCPEKRENCHAKFGPGPKSVRWTKFGSESNFCSQLHAIYLSPPPSRSPPQPSPSHSRDPPGKYIFEQRAIRGHLMKCLEAVNGPSS